MCVHDCVKLFSLDYKKQSEHFFSCLFAFMFSFKSFAELQCPLALALNFNTSAVCWFWVSFTPSQPHVQINRARTEGKTEGGDGEEGDKEKMRQGRNGEMDGGGE